MAEVGTEQRKRNIAYKLRIGDILKGVPMMDEGKFIFLELGDKKVLLLTGKNEENMNLSARNLYNVQIRESVGFSTYDVLRAEKLILQESAAKTINEVLG